MMMMAAGEWLQRKWLFTNDKQNHKNGKEKAWVNIFIYNNGKFPELDSMICSLYSLKGLMIRCYKWAGEQQLLTVSQLRGDHRLQERDLGLVLLLGDDAVLHQPRRQLVNAALLAEAGAARAVVGVLGSVLDILCGVAIESILVPIIVDHIWKVTVMKKRFRIICIDILIHCIFVSIWTGAGKIWCCKNNNKFVVEMLNEKYFLYKCKNIFWYSIVLLPNTGSLLLDCWRGFLPTLERDLVTGWLLAKEVSWDWYSENESRLRPRARGRGMLSNLWDNLSSFPH